MSILLIAIIIVILIVATFFLMIFLPKPHSFFIQEKICPELAIFTHNNFKDRLFEETKNIEKDFVIYENKQVSPKLYEFPLLDQLLRTIPDIQFAKIKIIPAGLNEKKHKEKASVANSTLRCLFPLKISCAKKSGVWCDGETKIFTLNEWIIYDHSREHSIFNKFKRRCGKILIVDITRPEDIPKGIAEYDTTNTDTTNVTNATNADTTNATNAGTTNAGTTNVTDTTATNVTTNATNGDTDDADVLKEDTKQIDKYKDISDEFNLYRIDVTLIR